MSQHPFKPGDRLLCIDGTSCVYLTGGKHYECRDICTDMVTITDDSGAVTDYMSRRFKYVDQPAGETHELGEPYVTQAQQFDAAKQEWHDYAFPACQGELRPAV